MSTASTPWPARPTDGAPRATVWPWLLALALFLMGIGSTLGGIGGSDGRSSSARAASTAVPHSQAVTSLTAALAAVEPGLGSLPAERVTSSAAQTCVDLSQGLSTPDLVDRTAARFSGTGYSLSDKQAEQIMAAVRSGYCGLSGMRVPR